MNLFECSPVAAGYCAYQRAIALITGFNRRPTRDRARAAGTLDEIYGNHTFFDTCHTTRLQTHGRSHDASGAGTGPERMGRSLNNPAALELCVARTRKRHEKSAAIEALVREAAGGFRMSARRVAQA